MLQMSWNCKKSAYCTFQCTLATCDRTPRMVFVGVPHVWPSQFENPSCSSCRFAFSRTTKSKLHTQQPILTTQICKVRNGHPHLPSPLHWKSTNRQKPWKKKRPTCGSTSASNPGMRTAATWKEHHENQSVDEPDNFVPTSGGLNRALCNTAQFTIATFGHPSPEVVMALRRVMSTTSWPPWWAILSQTLGHRSQTLF